MKILAPVKRVVDYNVKVRVKSDNTGVGPEAPIFSVADYGLEADLSAAIPELVNAAA